MTNARNNRSHVMLLDREGGAKDIGLDALASLTASDGLAWAHLDLLDDSNETWLDEHSDLEPHVTEALLADETRPRIFAAGDGLLIVIRGVNLAPGADPEDMVALRMWVEADRIISTFRRPLMSVADLASDLRRGDGPCNSGEFVVSLIERLGNRIEDFIESIDQQLDAFEDDAGDSDSTARRSGLGTLRRQTASVRRFLAPQREVLERLHRHTTELVSGDELLALREESDRAMRFLEELDLARERAIVLREEVLGRLAQEQNERMYVLSIVAAIFLPLTFVTGLLGMNVGGLPGTQNVGAFWWSLAIMLVLGIAVYAFLRMKRWL